MKRYTEHAEVWVVWLVLTGLLLAACSGGVGPATTAPTAQQQEPSVQEQPAALSGESLVAERCTSCHDLTRIQQATKTEAEWEATVARMVGKGARLSAEEQAAVIRYLAETYGP